MGAGVDPEDGGGGGGELEELDALFVGEFVPDVGENEERAFGIVRRERAGFDLRVEPAGLLGGELDGEWGRVVEAGPTQGGEGSQDPVGRDAAAATPVDERIGACGRRPAERRELGEDRVPLPSDPFAEGDVILGEVPMGLPVRGGSELLLEERRAESVEDPQVEVGEVHAASGMRRRWARRWLRMP